LAFTAVSLWIVVAILIIFDSKAESTKWAGLSAFLCSLNGFSFVWENIFYPLFSQYMNVSQSNVMYINQYTVIIVTVSLFFGPYALLMFGISYSDFFSDKLERFKQSAYLAALSLPLISFVLFLTQSRQFITRFELIVYLRTISYWAIPYALICICLLLYSTISEKSNRLKKERLLISTIAIPLAVLSLYLNHITPETDKTDIIMYNTWIIAIHFMGFTYFIVKYLLKKEHDQETLDEALNSGMAYINHAIKFRICKLHVCLNSFRNAVHNTPEDINGIMQTIDISQKSPEHLIEIVRRVQTSLRKISLKEETILLSSILEQSIMSSEQDVSAKRIHISRNYGNDAYLTCDPSLLIEALSNILRNAIESVRTDGKLSISAKNVKNRIVIDITDNGCGISKENLRRIYDPFFSTKQNDCNLGLGLSFASNVIHKHGGKLEIKSKEGIGTTVLVTLPNKTVQILSAPVVRHDNIEYVKEQSNISE